MLLINIHFADFEEYLALSCTFKYVSTNTIGIKRFVLISGARRKGVCDNIIFRVAAAWRLGICLSVGNGAIQLRGNPQDTSHPFSRVILGWVNSGCGTMYLIPYISTAFACGLVLVIAFTFLIRTYLMAGLRTEDALRKLQVHRPPVECVFPGWNSFSPF